MQINLLASVGLFLFAALGAIASPIQADSPGSFELGARDGDNSLLSYPGKCTKDKNECRYETQSGLFALVKCPEFANRRCTRDEQDCEWDRYLPISTLIASEVWGKWVGVIHSVFASINYLRFIQKLLI
ncbi:hypothetical protein P175DRAFT_0560638 [Aspergillus ochraceoroseus IBT 24754]|uniref:Antifungal protein n=1 Tax=Aspergillus ochraceoroseus IBT 24754 TaxID=1392256 RepID=A0A2T5LM99_9EURO|nr:uncharacterized protein P175DRAFT_0560638 [Aspergillus ochraceoroseus IBT 24754]PTU17405.1 hypothetical protein P175DRAFT_0560638 [Aspergillus ochraceoroseus IBT 24754]